MRKYPEVSYLRRLHLLLWYISFVLYGISTVMFFILMYKLTYDNIKRCFAMVVISTVLYLISNKLITHKKGYTSFQALMFYKKCCKAGLVKLEQCQRKSEQLKEMAVSYESLKSLNNEELLEAYEIGYNFTHGKDFK